MYNAHCSCTYIMMMGHVTSHCHAKGHNFPFTNSKVMLVLIRTMKNALILHEFLFNVDFN